MFSKILIANRGEIACRVMRTARRMGIKTVAVYSDADERALHVRMADEAVRIGEGPASESYLLADRIVDAVKQTGAEAVHPGFGFLSENTGFAERLAAEGITFIGPRPKAIAAMGDKIESKRIAQAAGVSTVPGHPDVVPDGGAAAKIAAEIGFPVMLKASAGGGGKGMRIARTEAEVQEGFALASSEAKSSFADDRVFVEKFIEQPRHIEIQVLADGHGNVIHLGERECSIQRRHQKVIEEAPSPFLDVATRAAMGEQAVALARAVEYQSAGTVEFIVDQDRNFYFLEMNTRLQVEHPVTEYVTGLDLVEQMIRIADGERLPIGQDDVRLRGWAIESRVYAEDPTRSFLPSTGRLVRYSAPPETEHVRVDTGVFEGGEISIYYDPMIAKLVCGGADRNEAIGRMREALDAFYIRGISHNIDFLAAVIGHARFIAGDLSTGFIEEEYPDGLTPRALTPGETGLLLAVAAAMHQRDCARSANLAGRVAGPAPETAVDCVIRLNGEDHAVGVRVVRGSDGDSVSASEVRLRRGGKTVAGRVESDWRPGDALFRGTVDERPVCVQVDRLKLGWRLSHAGMQVVVQVFSPRTAELFRRMPEKAPPDLSRFLLSPMPGLLVRLSVAEGDEIKAGEELAVVEAMKMENVLRAERDGMVKALHAAPGESLVVDQAILEFD